MAAQSRPDASASIYSKSHFNTQQALLDQGEGPDALIDTCRGALERYYAVRHPKWELFDLGLCLCVLKAAVPHGLFGEALERCSVTDRDIRTIASFAMRVFMRLSGKPESVVDRALDLGPGRVKELMVLSDEAFEWFVELDGGINGLYMADLKEMKVSEVRRRLIVGGQSGELERGEILATKAAPLAEKNRQLDGMGNRGHKVTVASENDREDRANPDELRALQPGDRISSLYASRPGAVVRVYADGSAAVRWDDGRPQPAGLAHERMPRELLVWVAAGAAPEVLESASEADEDEVLEAALRDLARLLAVGAAETYSIAAALVDLRASVGDVRFAELCAKRLGLSVARVKMMWQSVEALNGRGLLDPCQRARLAALGVDKLSELVKQPDVVLQALAAGGTHNGHSLEALKAMDLREFVVSLVIQVDEIDHGAGDDSPVLHFRPLRPGDRIKSFRAQRPGAVVKVYADGSAAVRWDDGRPQPAGLAHERVPRALLVWVGAGAGLDTRREYAMVLAKLLLNRVEADEVDGVIAALEGEVRTISEARPAPGLVAARYDAFSRFMMGGVK